MQFAELWQAWPVAGPWRLVPFTMGTNKRIWQAECPDGQTYVLRSLTPNQVSQIGYETALLAALSHRSLPFQLPIPIPTSTGDVLVPFTMEETSASAFACLTQLLPGRMPGYNDFVSAPWAGEALARLDQALATLPSASLANEHTAPPAFGNLAQIHPGIPDPLAAVKHLPIETDAARQIMVYLSQVIEQVPALYAHLPQQLLHRDYDPTNILIDERRVTGVVDFEFAGYDLRVLDLCIALSWWPLDLMGTGREWEMIDLFANAYLKQFPLTETELRALPQVMRLRDSVSLVHRVGRYLAGLENDARIQQRILHSLWRENWLSANRETLLQHTIQWSHEAQQR